VLPIEKCYSIRWPEHEHFFKEQFLEETMNRVNNSLIVHVWNKHSMKTNLTIDAKVAYVELAKRFCPKVIQSSGNYF
jgi:lactosylceramide 4-alpha-galactosyltransferase